MIRQATLADIEQVTALYRDTIATVNAKHYNLEQTTVWAGRWVNTSAWIDKITDQHFLVAETERLITGFGSITTSGHVNMLFVHSAYQGMGIARKLFNALQTFAIQQQYNSLTTDASITARPVFEHFGFSVIKAQTVVLEGVELINYQMQKWLT
jgi:putative acetyltransferase